MVKRVTLDEEFKKNPSMKKAELENLKEWCIKQAHLPPIPDELLALFFHSCYFRMEATKITIDNYFTVRTHVPEFFDNRDPYTTNINNGKPIVQFSMFNNSTPEGYRILLSKLVDTDPSNYNFPEAVKHFFMVADLGLYLDGTSPGFILVVDMDGAKFGHLARVNVLSMKKFLYYLQEAMPVRLKGMHFINIVPFMDSVLALMRPFMKKELTEMLHLHSDLKTLFPYVPEKILPKEFGGEDKPLSDLLEQTQKSLQENKKWFVDDSKMRVVESKRAGKAKSAGDIFGVEGSFKKLDLD